MKSTRAKAYINESLTLEMSGAFGVSQQDAIRAVEIAENDMLVKQCDRHKEDLQFLEGMLDDLDNNRMEILRRSIDDWRDELERRISDLKREINA